MAKIILFSKRKHKITVSKKMIIDTYSGENRIVLSTVTHVYSSLLVAIKPDAITNGIGYDGEVTPFFNLNFS